MSETQTQSMLRINRKNPSVTKYAANQKSEMSTQEKQASYSEIHVVKHIVTMKGLQELRNFGNNYYMNGIFQCLVEGALSLRSSPKQLVRKEGRNLHNQVLALLMLLHNTEGKVHPASKTYCQS